MIKCPECKKEISSEAKYCPHCGFPISEKTSKVVDAKVEPIKEEDKKPVAEVAPSSKDEKLIEQYENEIAIYSRRRRIMVTWGSVLFAVGLIGVIVFSVLLAVGLAREIPQSQGDPSSGGRIAGIAILYYFMIVLMSLCITAGTVLIPVGAIPNSIKITKRENKIRALRR